MYFVTGLSNASGNITFRKKHWPIYFFPMPRSHCFSLRCLLPHSLSQTKNMYSKHFAAFIWQAKYVGFAVTQPVLQIPAICHSLQMHKVHLMSKGFDVPPYQGTWTHEVAGFREGANTQPALSEGLVHWPQTPKGPLCVRDAEHFNRQPQTISCISKTQKGTWQKHLWWPGFEKGLL